MYSTDGISWTGSSNPPAGGYWDVTYGNGYYVAVNSDGGSSEVIYSTDGATWSSATTPNDSSQIWLGIAYGEGVYVAVGRASNGTSNVMTATDPSGPWTTQTGAADNNWIDIAYGSGRFVAVACGTGSSCNTTAGDRVMTAVWPTPIINSIDPTTRTAGTGNFTLTVSGTQFMADSVVRINGVARTTNTASYASGTLTASILASDIASAGSKPVTVYNPANGTTSNAINVSVSNPVPTTTSLAPDIVTVGGAQFDMLVNGTNFNASSVVRVNGSNRTTTYQSATQLIATIPATDINTSGTKTVTVFNPTPGGGTSNGQTLYINNPEPTVGSIAPTSFIRGTTGTAANLTVNGTNFISSSVVNVNGSPRTTQYVSGTQLTANVTTADMSAAGTLTITVTNPSPGGGTSVSSADLSILNPGPTIASLDPSSRNVGSGAFTLTVNGSNFVSDSVVRFEGADRVTTYVNAGQLTASILAGDIASVGLYAITVFNPTPGGGTSNSMDLSVSAVGTAAVGHSPASPFVTDAVTIESSSEHPEGIDTVELYLDGDLVHTCDPVGSPTELDCDFEVGTLDYGSHEIEAVGTSVTDSEFSDSETFHVSDYTLLNSVTLSRLKVSESAEVTARYTLQGELSGVVTVTFPAGFTVTGAPTDEASSPCLSAFGFNGPSRTIYATKTACSDDIVLGGATVTNPGSAGVYQISWVNDDPGGGPVYITDEDQINVTATVNPYVTFRVVASADACDNGADGSHDDTSPAGNGGTVDFGTLSPTAVASSDVGGVNHVCTFVSTNAGEGYGLSVRSLNGQLLSGSTGAAIPTAAQTGVSSTATASAGTQAYGMCLLSSGGVGMDVSLPAGSNLAASAPFDSACTGVSTSESMGRLTTDTNVIGTNGGPVQDGWARWLLKVSIPATQTPATDYADTLTFVATATY